VGPLNSATGATPHPVRALAGHFHGRGSAERAQARDVDRPGPPPRASESTWHTHAPNLRQDGAGASARNAETGTGQVFTVCRRINVSSEK
jgi:hypothetical protein